MELLFFMAFTYKQLLSAPMLLKVRARARALMADGSDLVAIYYNQKQLVFKTRSGTDRNIVWTQVIEINDATLDFVMGKTTFKDVEDLIKNSGLRVHCDCPAYKYWGMQNKGTRMGYALIPEYRRPTKSNRMPGAIPMVCKHLYLVLQLYPFWSKTLASKFRNYYYNKEDKGGINRLDRVRQNQANRDFVQKQEQQKQEQKQQTQINVNTATEQDLEDLLSQ